MHVRNRNAQGYIRVTADRKCMCLGEREIACFSYYSLHHALINGEERQYVQHLVISIAFPESRMFRMKAICFVGTDASSEVL